MPAIKADAQSEIDLSSSIVVKGKEKIPPSGMFSNSFEQYLLKADNADTSAFRLSSFSCSDLFLQTIVICSQILFITYIPT